MSTLVQRLRETLRTFDPESGFGPAIALALVLGMGLWLAIYGAPTSRSQALEPAPRERLAYVPSHFPTLGTDEFWRVETVGAPQDAAGEAKVSGAHPTREGKLEPCEPSLHDTHIQVTS